METNGYKILLHRAIKELPKDKFAITSKGEYRFAYVTSMELAAMMNILITKDGLNIKPVSRIRATAEAKVEGYECIRIATCSAIVVSKSDDEIEALKTSWAKDPCWDIEDTDGFEYHYEELRAYRIERSERIEKEVLEKREKRIQFVKTQTGVNDVDIAAELRTWHEIERDVVYATRDENYWSMELAAAQVRATLLQAAQLKRIADALVVNKVSLKVGLLESLSGEALDRMKQAINVPAKKGDGIYE